MLTGTSSLSKQSILETILKQPKDISGSSELSDKNQNTCEKCSKSFPTRDKYTKHLYQHKPRRFHCKICSHASISATALKIHNRHVHEKIRNYSCNLCSYKGCFPSNVKSHMKTVHLKQHRYKCDICGKGFGTTKTLESHKLTVHEGIRFHCDICKKMYKCHEHFVRHMKKHSPEYNAKNNCVCELCSKVFADITDLKVHVRKHVRLSDPGEMCEICGKTYKYLALHMKRHQNEKNHVCDYCGKAFICRANLVIHLRIHTGEKPYKCKFCEKSFNQRPPLKIHMRLHTGERPYSCEICKKSFVSKGSLNQHVCKGYPSK